MALKTPLNGKQRRYLRSLAHHRDPVVQVGWQGVTEALSKALDQALEDHELVKVKLAQGVEDREETADKLAETTDAECVQIIGRVVLIYRPRKKDPLIVLPGQTAPMREVDPAERLSRARKKIARKTTRRG